MNYEKFSLRNRKVQISLDFRKNIIFSNLIYSVIFKIIICQGLPQTSKNVEQKKLYHAIELKALIEASKNFKSIASNISKTTINEFREF